MGELSSGRQPFLDRRRSASIARMILSIVRWLAVCRSVSMRDKVSCRTPAKSANRCWLKPTPLRSRMRSRAKEMRGRIAARGIVHAYPASATAATANLPPPPRPRRDIAGRIRFREGGRIACPRLRFFVAASGRQPHSSANAKGKIGKSRLFARDLPRAPLC